LQLPEENATISPVVACGSNRLGVKATTQTSSDTALMSVAALKALGGIHRYNLGTISMFFPSSPCEAPFCFSEDCEALATVVEEINEQQLPINEASVLKAVTTVVKAVRRSVCGDGQLRQHEVEQTGEGKSQIVPALVVAMAPRNDERILNHMCEFPFGSDLALNILVRVRIGRSLDRGIASK
jgi:hypothetical protein